MHTRVRMVPWVSDDTPCSGEGQRRRPGLQERGPPGVGFGVPGSGFCVTVRLSQLSGRRPPPCLALQLLLGLGPGTWEGRGGERTGGSAAVGGGQ